MLCSLRWRGREWPEQGWPGSRAVRGRVMPTWEESCPTGEAGAEGAQGRLARNEVKGATESQMARTRPS